MRWRAADTPRRPALRQSRSARHPARNRKATRIEVDEDSQAVACGLERQARSGLTEALGGPDHELITHLEGVSVPVKTGAG